MPYPYRTDSKPRAVWPAHLEHLTMAPITRTAPNGARQVLDRQAYLAREAAQGRTDAARHLATCGHCGRTWDDGIVSGVTPAPSARCPFENSHKESAS